ncbi:response regulator [Brevundimonas balnearis]|uniref:Response regulator n=1 Tax=Brevundimonas balnearis TaxID=1572858 RepID=A0ABV6R0I4_9CAUL
MSAGLNGRKVLIVEDESLVAMLIETILEDLGCETIGPMSTIDEALGHLDGGDDLDAALLDVNLAGRQVFPVAEALEARGVPVVFSTGYGEGGLPDRWRDRPTVQKPFTEAGLRQALFRAMGVAEV